MRSIQLVILTLALSHLITSTIHFDTHTIFSTATLLVLRRGIHFYIGWKILTVFNTSNNAEFLFAFLSLSISLNSDQINATMLNSNKCYASVSVCKSKISCFSAVILPLVTTSKNDSLYDITLRRTLKLKIRAKSRFSVIEMSNASTKAITLLTKTRIVALLDI